jgi:hypothetical protein
MLGDTDSVFRSQKLIKKNISSPKMGVLKKIIPLNFPQTPWAQKYFLDLLFSIFSRKKKIGSLDLCKNEKKQFFSFFHFCTNNTNQFSFSLKM